MIFIKQLFYRILSQRNYLKLLNSSFLMLYKLGFLKSQQGYQYHYFAKKLVWEGDTVIDLGANLGYYSNLFAKWIGNNGELYAVEPVKPFQEILQWKLGNKSNVHILPYALGTEEKTIKMVIPSDHKYLKTGLPHVYDPGADGAIEEYGFSFEARMKKGSELFSKLEAVDFIKCDIEGYEEFVLPEIKSILEKHKPIVQVETWGTHRKVVEDLFDELGYNQYQLSGNRLKLYKDIKKPEADDYIFIHPANEKARQKLAAIKING